MRPPASAAPVTISMKCSRLSAPTALHRKLTQSVDNDKPAALVQQSVRTGETGKRWCRAAHPLAGPASYQRHAARRGGTLCAMGHTEVSEGSRSCTGGKAAAYKGIAQTSVMRRTGANP